MSSTLRVMTANLYGRRVDLDALDAVLDDVDPDVIALQEVDSRALKLIAERFQHRRIEPYAPRVSSGIATRFAATFTPIDFSTRAAWSARLASTDWPDLTEDVEVVGVHFDNPVRWPYWESASARRQQVDALRSHLAAETHPRILVGDFNATPIWPVYRSIATFMTDAAVASDSAVRTWGPRGIGPPLLRLDQVFVEGLTPVSTFAVKIPKSDHLALVADLAPRR